MRKLFLVSIFLFILLLNAASHEFIVKPEKIENYSSGDIVELLVLSTHYFMVGEELEPAELNSLYVIQGGKKTEINLEPDKEALVYKGFYKLESNSPAIAVAIEREFFTAR